MIGSHFWYALLAGVVPSLIWLFFWLREDRLRPEPRPLLAGCFIGGAGIVFVAIILEQYIATVAGTVTVQYVMWSVIEESLKFIVVALVALRSLSNDEPIDAMIYSVAVALGFAAVENTLFIMGPFSQGSLAQGLVTGNMRFIGATLVHVVSSAFVGFGLGWTFYRSRFLKTFGWAVGLASAIMLHAAFNLSIVNAGSMDTLKTFGFIWVAVVGLIVLFEEVKAVRPRLV